MNDKLQTSTLIMRGPRRSERDFWKVSSSWKNFSSSQVAQLINGKNPRESWHFWPKMDLFSERIFMTVNLLKTLGKKNSCWWKTSVFRSGRYWFFTGQMDFCVQTIENGWKNFQLSNQRPIFCLFKWWSHMGNYLTKAEKLQFRHSTWDKEFFD